MLDLQVFAKTNCSAEFAMLVTNRRCLEHMSTIHEGTKIEYPGAGLTTEAESSKEMIT
jgi:hypothetical protein